MTSQLRNGEMNGREAWKNGYKATMDTTMSFLTKKGVTFLFVVTSTAFLLYAFFVLRDDVICSSTTEQRQSRRLASQTTTRTTTEASSASMRRTVDLEGLPAFLGRDVLHFKGMYAARDVKLFLYASYLDDRVSPNVVRVIGVQERGLNVTGFRCGFPRDGEVTWSAGASWEFIDRSWPHWSPYFAVHIECPLAADGAGAPPPEVSVFYGERADQHVRLPVERPTASPAARPLAVVVKPITGQFSVGRLVEWIELNRLVGVDTFVLYDTDLSGAGGHVLRYYQSAGVVHVVPFPYLTSVLERAEEADSVTPEQRYAIYQQVYLVALHDALYRFHRLFRYLVVVDLDEVILPTRRGSLLAVAERLSADYADGAGFTFPTAWHFQDAGPLDDPDVPDYLYMQRYARASAPDAIQPKSLLVTSRTRTLNFHAVVTTLAGSYEREVSVDWRHYGYVHHYRGLCASKFAPDMCENILKNSSVDYVMTRYLNDLRGRVYEVMEHLQLR